MSLYFDYKLTNCRSLRSFYVRCVLKSPVPISDYSQVILSVSNGGFKHRENQVDDFHTKLLAYPDLYINNTLIDDANFFSLF